MSIQRSVLERLRKGDEQAFEVVYHAFHRRIYGFLLSSLGEDESAAEDLLQSFSYVYGKPGRISTWTRIYGLPFYNSSQSGV